MEIFCHIFLDNLVNQCTLTFPQSLESISIFVLSTVMRYIIVDFHYTYTL